MDMLSGEADAVISPSGALENSNESVPMATSSHDARWAVALGLAYPLLFYVTSLLPTPQHTLLNYTSSALSTLVALALLMGFTVRAARATRTGRSLLLSFLTSAALSLPLIILFIGVNAAPHLPIWPRIMKSPVTMTYGGLLGIPGLRQILLVWLAVCIGVGLSRLIRELKMLLPVAAVLALVDLYVVFGGGLVTQAQTGQPAAQAAMRALSASLPRTARPSAGGGVEPLQLSIGFADFLFVALFFACFARFGVRSKRTFQVLCIVLTLYMGVVAFRDVALPALVPIAVVVIGMNLRQFRYERSEAFALLYAGLIVAAVMGALWFFSRPSSRPTQGTSRAASPTASEPPAAITTPIATNLWGRNRPPASSPVSAGAGSTAPS